MEAHISHGHPFGVNITVCVGLFVLLCSCRLSQRLRDDLVDCKIITAGVSCISLSAATIKEFFIKKLKKGK